MSINKTERKIKTAQIIEYLLRTTIIIFSGIMVLWYFSSGFIGFGSVTGTVFFTFLIGAAVFFNSIKKIACMLKHTKGGSILLYSIITLFALFMIYIITILCLIIHGSDKTPEKDATIIVLGCQVRGEEPSQTLKARLDTAYDYMIKKPSAKAILSGGKGSNENLSEADCMYKYLTQKGIAKERLFVENKSTTTDENILFSKKIIEQNGLNTDIAIITDWYHEYRASVIASKHGLRSGSIPAPTAGHLTAHLVTREIFAVGYNLFK